MLLICSWLGIIRFIETRFFCHFSNLYENILVTALSPPSYITQQFVSRSLLRDKAKRKAQHEYDSSPSEDVVPSGRRIKHTNLEPDIYWSLGSFLPLMLSSVCILLLHVWACVCSHSRICLSFVNSKKMNTRILRKNS